MRLTLILTILACLIIGAGGGYAKGYMKYEPIIQRYTTEVSDLMSELSKSEQKVSNQAVVISTLMSEQLILLSEKSTLQTEKSQLEAEKSTLLSEKSGLESEKTALQSKVSGLQSEKASLQSEISSLETAKSALQSEISTIKTEMSSIQSDLDSAKEQAATLQSQIGSLKGRLQNILGVTVIQNYQWVYQLSSWKWELKIPLSLYVDYLETQRPQLLAYWVEMAKDPKDDSYIDYMLQQINNAAVEKHYSDVQKLNFVIAFVQSLPYTVDKVTTPYDEYPRYPIETLFDRGGDCEDTSILVAALLDRMGYDVCLLHLKYAGHMAVGVSTTNVNVQGSYYEYNGKKYFYLETTGDGFQIGQTPSSITDTRATLYPL